jgi:hypothetical protein
MYTYDIGRYTSCLSYHIYPHYVCKKELYHILISNVSRILPLTIHHPVSYNLRNLPNGLFLRFVTNLVQRTTYKVFLVFKFELSSRFHNCRSSVVVVAKDFFVHNMNFGSRHNKNLSMS